MKLAVASFAALSAVDALNIHKVTVYPPIKPQEEWKKDYPVDESPKTAAAAQKAYDDAYAKYQEEKGEKNDAKADAAKEL